MVYYIHAGGGQISNSIGVLAANNYFSPVPGYTTSTKAIASTSNNAIYQNQRSSKTNTYSVSEEANPGTLVGTVKASTLNADDVLTYTITGGNTNKAFSINATTGAITLAKRLSYHSQSTYTLKVKVTDSSNLNDEVTVTISVNPGNSVPTFTNITWATAASQPYTISEGQGQAVNGKLYTFGGFDSQKSGFTPTNRAFVYNPMINTWSPIAPMPSMNGTQYGGLTHGGFATDGTDIYFAGGYTANSTGTGQIFGSKEIWQYIVAENRYVRLRDLPVKTAAGQLVYLQGKLHYVGGTNASRTSDLGNHYALDLDNQSAGWKSLALLPNPRHHAGSVVFAGKIYYIGGQHGHDSKLRTQKDVHEYNPATNSWLKKADLPVPSGANGRGHISSAVVIISNRILVLGGETVHNTGRTNMVSAFNPDSNNWQSLTPLPKGRYSGVAAVLSGLIYYTGGSNSSVTYKGTPEQTNTVTGITETLKTKVISPATAPQLMVYPNPSNKLNDKISVRIQHFPPKEKVMVSIFDLLGRMLQSTIVKLTPEGNATVEIPLSTSLNQGMYMIQAKSGSVKVQTKILKE